MWKTIFDFCMLIEFSSQTTNFVNEALDDGDGCCNHCMNCKKDVIELNGIRTTWKSTKIFLLKLISTVDLIRWKINASKVHIQNCKAPECMDCNIGLCWKCRITWNRRYSMKQNQSSVQSRFFDGNSYGSVDKMTPTMQRNKTNQSPTKYWLMWKK